MMAESSEVQALEKISTEVGESQIKITLSSQCIKAQAFLVDKLRKQSERQKEICSFISSNNLKLQSEIKQAELEIKSLLISHDTIKSGNTEVKKELLLAREKKFEIAERVSNGEKKYEALWLESKERYESIPFVQKLLQATSKIQNLKDSSVALESRSQSLKNELITKKVFFANLDRTRIIELADYLINYLPSTIKVLKEKLNAIDEVSKEIDRIVKDRDTNVNEHVDTAPIEEKELIRDEIKTTKLDEVWMNISTNDERDMVIKMPRLQFKNSDFDALNARLDKIKIMKVEIMNTSSTSLKRTNPAETMSELCKKRMKDDEFSIFFNNSNNNKAYIASEKKDDTYTRKKLINILDDVKLDKNEAYNMVSKINLENLKEVSVIDKDNKKLEECTDVSDKKEIENIEEIDLTQPTPDKNNSSILVPPTQFLDLTQEKIFSSSQQLEVIVHMSVTEPSAGTMSQSFKTSQESLNRKRVSFDLPLSIQEITNKTNEEEMEKNYDVNKTNDTVDSQADLSIISDESYTKMKEMILKKHNLDMSPQFTYTKARMLQTSTDENIVTSKFFQTEKSVIDNRENNNQNITHDSLVNENQEPSNIEAIAKENDKEMGVDQVIVSSPKATHMGKTNKSVTGLLFNHNTQGIPDSLNVSISTTGFDEGDADFPHCIDSSLLLSPKADLPMPMSGDNVDVTSQEVPNFLSGLRKTGLSFFGQSTATDSKPDASGQNSGSNFNFNFGGGDQKARGGLFSMFR